MKAKVLRKPVAAKRVIPRRKPVKGGRAKKLAISFEPELAAQIQTDARATAGGNVSAWMAEAAREHLRIRAMQVALDAYEAEHGVITEEEMAEAKLRWKKA